MAQVTDFSVEVFTTNSGYLSIINDPDTWTRVANAQGIPSPDGRSIVILPEQFTPISLGARQKLSIYIQMKGTKFAYNVTNHVPNHCHSHHIVADGGFVGLRRLAHDCYLECLPNHEITLSRTSRSYPHDVQSTGVRVQSFYRGIPISF